MKPYLNDERPGSVGEIPVVLFSFLKLALLVEVSVKNLVPFSHFLQTSSVSSL